MIEKMAPKLKHKIDVTTTLKSQYGDFATTEKFKVIFFLPKLSTKKTTVIFEITNRQLHWKYAQHILAIGLPMDLVIDTTFSNHTIVGGVWQYKICKSTMVDQNYYQFETFNWKIKI